MVVVVVVAAVAAAADAEIMINWGSGIVLVFSCVQTGFSFWWYRLECHPTQI